MKKLLKRLIKQYRVLTGQQVYLAADCKIDLTKLSNQPGHVNQYNPTNNPQVLAESADKDTSILGTEYRDSLPNFLVYQTDRELEYARWISYLHCRLTQETALKEQEIERVTRLTEEINDETSKLMKESERVAWLSGRNQELVKEKELIEDKLKTLRNIQLEIMKTESDINANIKEMANFKVILPERDVLRDVSGAKSAPLNKRKVNEPIKKGGKRVKSKRKPAQKRTSKRSNK